MNEPLDGTAARDPHEAAVIEDLTATLERWATAAPPPPTLAAFAGTDRARPHGGRWRRAGLALAAAASVAALATLGGVALHRTDSVESGGAACGDATAAPSEGPPGVEVQLVGPARAVSGSRIEVQVRARALDGRPHHFTTGLIPDEVWLEGGRVAGWGHGPESDVGMAQYVPADGSWTTFRWGADPLARAFVGVSGCYDIRKGGQDPLPPGRYDLVVTFAPIPPDAPYAVYVTRPLRVEVVAAP